MGTHSERFTANCPGGKDCGDGHGEGVVMGRGGGGFAGVTGNVIDEFNVEVKTLGVAESGGSSLTGAVFPSCRGDSGGGKRNKGSGATKSKDWTSQFHDFGQGMPPELT